MLTSIATGMSLCYAQVFVKEVYLQFALTTANKSSRDFHPLTATLIRPDPAILKATQHRLGNERKLLTLARDNHILPSTAYHDS